MLYAIVNGEKTQASPGIRGTCPECSNVVLARCGHINLWHWAHESNDDCPYSKKEETEWHLNWKRKFPKSMTEVKIGNNRADVVIGGFVLEFQNSSIDYMSILDREISYKNMAWIVNGHEFMARFYTRDYGSYEKFTWFYRRKYVELMSKQVLLDFSEQGHLFVIKKNHGKFGWGYKITPEKFLSKLNVKV